MSLRPLRPLVALLLLAIVAVPSDTVRAEVYARDVDGRVRTLVSGYMPITDGVDPIPHLVWQPFRPGQSEYILNPGGAMRPDGRPDIFYREGTGVPVVVWAIQQLEDGQPTVGHDIAYATWHPGGWSTTLVLAATGENEVDPRVFVERDGTAHVVWWIDSPDPRVMMQSRSSTVGAWSASLQISPFGEDAFRPSVTVADGTLRVAYERDNALDPFDDTHLVIRRRVEVGIWVEEDAISSNWSGPLNAVLHSRDGHVWVDWQHSMEEFAYSELTDDGWSEPVVEPWDDFGWVGVEMIRHIIETRIIRQRGR